MIRNDIYKPELTSKELDSVKYLIIDSPEPGFKKGLSLNFIDGIVDAVNHAVDNAVNQATTDAQDVADGNSTPVTIEGL